jgi:hypothetical protein
MFKVADVEARALQGLLCGRNYCGGRELLFYAFTISNETTTPRKPLSARR